MRCALLAASACAASADMTPCHGRAPYVHVDTSSHRLWLCEGATPDGVVGVRLGKGGVGKTSEGDGKVPLGRYELGKPRRSEKFGLFIPIAYPTAAQRALGYTGGSVGIHGPHRSVRWLGSLVNAFDTTDGCVGLATDEETAQVASGSRDTRSLRLWSSSSAQGAVTPAAALFVRTARGANDTPPACARELLLLMGRRLSGSDRGRRLLSVKLNGCLRRAPAVANGRAEPAGSATGRAEAHAILRGAVAPALA